MISVSANFGTGDPSGCCCRSGFYSHVPVSLHLCPLFLATSVFERRCPPQMRTGVAEPSPSLLRLLPRLLSPLSRRRLGRMPAPRRTEPG